MGRRLWRSGLGSHLGAFVVCVVGAAAAGSLLGLVFSSAAGAETTVEVLYPLIVMCLVLTGVVLWSVSAHGVALRRPELALLSSAGATGGQLTRLVLTDAAGVGLVAGALGGLVSLATVFPLGALLVARGWVADLAVAAHPLVLVCTTVGTAVVAAGASLTAAVAPGRRRARASGSPVLRAVRVGLGGLLLAWAATRYVTVARTTDSDQSQAAGTTTFVLVVALCLLAPVLLRVATTIVRAVSGASTVLTVAGAQTRASALTAPVVAATIATVLGVYLAGTGSLIETTGRAALAAHPGAAAVVTADGDPLTTDEVDAVVAGPTDAPEGVLVLGRTSATRETAFAPLPERVAVVDPYALKEMWQGPVTGDLAAFGPGAAVVPEALLGDHPLGSTIRFTGDGPQPVDVRVVAALPVTGPWGTLLSPPDAQTLAAPTSYDVLTTDAQTTEALVQGAPAGALEAVTPTRWTASLSNQEVLDGSGGDDVGLVLAIPVLLCATLAAASTAMAHTRRARERRTLSAAGATPLQQAVTDQLQALLPVGTGLAAGAAAAVAAIAITQANITSHLELDLPLQLPWPSLTTLTAALLAPALVITAIQNLWSQRGRHAEP